MFKILENRACPALMVPVADPGAVCMQSPPVKTGRNPATGVSVTVKEPGPIVTNWGNVIYDFDTSRSKYDKRANNLPLGIPNHNFVAFRWKG